MEKLSVGLHSEGNADVVHDLFYFFDLEKWFSAVEDYCGFGIF